MIRIEDRHDWALIEWDAEVAPYAAVAERKFAVPGEPDSSPARAATVEIYRQLGGGPQRAILGGIKRPSEDRTLSVAIPTSGPFHTMKRFSSPSLSGKPFTAGLCDEDLQPVLAGLLHWPTTVGELRVTSAAYHDEGTSWFAQLVAAQILSRALHVKSDNLTGSEIEAIRQLLRTSARA